MAGVGSFAVDGEVGIITIDSPPGTSCGPISTLPPLASIAAFAVLGFLLLLIAAFAQVCLLIVRSALALARMCPWG